MIYSMVINILATTKLLNLLLTSFNSCVVFRTFQGGYFCIFQPSNFQIQFLEIKNWRRRILEYFGWFYKVLFWAISGINPINCVTFGVFGRYLVIFDHFWHLNWLCSIIYEYFWMVFGCFDDFLEFFGSWSHVITWRWSRGVLKLKDHVAVRD